MHLTGTFRLPAEIDPSVVVINDMSWSFLIAPVGSGHEIHPINVHIGGFYRAPRRSELRAFAERLKWAREAAQETVRWLAGLEFPDRERDYAFVALQHASEYALN
jgi:coenzyme F420-reducing hydrogenase alpha subunit